MTLRAVQIGTEKFPLPCYRQNKEGYVHSPVVRAVHTMVQEISHIILDILRLIISANCTQLQTIIMNV